MTVGAQLSVTDQRRMARHPVDHPVIAEHFGKGDVHLHIANVSSNGFMIDNAEDIARGEAYCIWIRDNRAGFQFERIIRVDDFLAMIDTLQPNPRLRKLR